MKKIMKKVTIGLIALASGALLWTGANKLFNHDEIIYATDFIDENTFANYSAADYVSKEFVYLSDIPYMPEVSSVGWGTIKLDASYEANINNGLISLIVNGKQKTFLKGVSAHATSTVIYDISQLDFDYFTTYYGVDASRGSNGNGVKFSIYTSVDGVEWSLHTPVSPSVKKGNSEAEHIDIDIRGKNYIKLYCHNNGNATADHCAYGGAKLYKEGYNESEEQKPFDFIKPVEEYDQILKNTSYEELINNKEKETILLKRKFVSLFGYDMLQNMAHLDNDHKETIKWLMSDYDALKYYITGGKPIGSYFNSLNVLISLYTKYSADLNDNTQAEYTVMGDLYKRMMISLSLTHSGSVCLWVGGNQCSNAVDRYNVYKTMHAKNLLINKVFENLNIEEMRWVMNNIIDDEEIEWLNHYIRKFPTQWGPYNTNPYAYITYRFGYNYSLAQYYDLNNFAKWDAKYDLAEYNITYKAGKPKLWIVFEQGSVCGGLSKTGSNINASLGNPSGVIGQPAHAAYLEYYETADGRGAWTIKNNVGGWTVAEKSERLLAGWGSNSWDSYYNVSYVPYAQEALDDLENYNKALEIMTLASVYADDPVKLEEIYNKALEYQVINMDAWYGLIKAYQANSNKTALDYINLAKRLADNMFYFPVPMYDLMNLIKPNLNGTIYAATFTNYLRASLIKTTKLGKEIPTTLVTPAISVVMANSLLGKNDYSIASFSFDGENANKIILGSKYEGNETRWEYSLDNGNSWHATSETEVLLSSSDVAKITAENDIKIHIVGTNYDEENIYTIDITKGAISPNLFANDLENRIVGIDLTYEWRFSEENPWVSYNSTSPDLTGDKTVEIRVGATRTALPSESVSYSFTSDNQSDTRKYIPVSHLSIAGVSTEATSNAGAATNAIDANYNTRWHSAWNGTDTQRYIIVKLDKPAYISAVEFVPAGGGNGKIYDGTIYGSTDGENWEVLTSEKNFRYTNQANTIADAITNTKSFEISSPKEVQYIKIVADRTNGNWFTARAFNFYQDLTIFPRPTAGIGYSTTSPTKDDVVARLVNPSTNITITNNEGKDTYVFKENGSFTFEFVDEHGQEGSAKATVDWIDRTSPSATIEYSTTKVTNKEVLATLKPSEEVIVTNNGKFKLDNDGNVLDENGNILEGYTIDEEGYVHDEEGNVITYMNSFVYEFTDNGSFTFEFIDKAGNKGSAIAKVTWIDKEIANATFDYNIREITNKDVIVTIKFDKENVKILNNNGKNTYTFKENGSFTFEYMDEAGNLGSKTVYVNWINKSVVETKVVYSTLNPTRGEVIATLESSSPITILNNDGKNTYTFTKNDSFIFIYEDKNGNRGKAIAFVNWIISDNQGPIILGGSVEDNITVLPNPNKKPSTNENKNILNQIINVIKPNTPSTEDNNQETLYKEFTTSNLKIRLIDDNAYNNAVLRKDKLELDDALIKRFSANSEYYDIYLEDIDKMKIKISDKDVKMTLELNDEKEFLGIYSVSEEGKVKALNYNKIKDNIIEFDTKGLEKYVISYKDVEKENQEEVKDEIDKNTFIFVIGGILILSAVTYVLNSKNKK